MGRPVFKTGWGRQAVPGGFDSHPSPPRLQPICARVERATGRGNRTPAYFLPRPLWVDRPFASQGRAASKAGPCGERSITMNFRTPRLSASAAAGLARLGGPFCMMVAASMPWHVHDCCVPVARLCGAIATVPGKPVAEGICQGARPAFAC